MVKAWLDTALNGSRRWLDRLDHQPWLIRLMIAAMFLESGCDKLVHMQTYLDDVAAHKIPFPPLSLMLVTAIELIGGAAVLCDIALVPALLALAIYTLMVNFFYFDFWSQAMPGAVMARKEFLKNLAVVGGLLAWALAAWKSGKRWG